MESHMYKGGEQKGEEKVADHSKLILIFILRVDHFFNSEYVISISREPLGH
jgi:hypothetical protein